MCYYPNTLPMITMVLQYSVSVTLNTLQDSHLQYITLSVFTKEQKNTPEAKSRNCVFTHCSMVSVTQNLITEMKQCAEKYIKS